MGQKPLDSAMVGKVLDPTTEEVQRRAVELRAGGILSAEAVGHLLGISRQVVDERRRAGVLLALPQAADWEYPRAQFHNGKTIPGLADIIAAFGASGPWVTLEFLVTEDTVLDGLTPREALLRGGDMHGRVMALVRGYNGGEGFG
ncbi:hypothetical protein [Paracraurococcus lichenis]|uniref:DNA-binding protein n=1 Tax=Paracraurococcus lichenis TaxID=3064888 RepID=A0ABT9E7T3_9PROT|nr:hypothetical protein [Paracraurococcus sp. LOR1-02]MDO9712239.1 hypothetical protein [Paracraurococcus sp. LOR1-02]